MKDLSGLIEAVRGAVKVLIRLIECYDDDELLGVVHEKLIEVLESFP